MPNTKQQVIVRKAAGLFLHPNRYEAPEGALWTAMNCEIVREGILSKRRGFNRYGNILSNVPSGLFEWDGTLIVLDGTTLKYDSGAGVWASWTGSYSPPDGSTDMQALEANLNFLFLTSLGPYVNDDLSNTPKRAGTPAGLDLQIVLSTGGGGWQGATQVAYRVVWRRTDDNQNEKRGAPSYRRVITNPLWDDQAWSRSAAVVTVTSVSHGLSPTDSIEVTDSSDTAAIPNGTYTVQTTPTSDTFTLTGIAAGGTSGTLDWNLKCDQTITTTIPDDIAAGDVLEIYRTEESADDAIDPGDRLYRLYEYTVLAADITNGYCTFTDTYDASYLGIGLYTNDSEQGATQEKARPPFAKYMALFEGHTFYANCRREHYKTIKLTAVSGLVDDTSSITIDDGSTSETYTFSTAEDIGNKKFQRFTAGTVAQNVRDTMWSFCKIVNRASAEWYAHYISSVDDAPGEVLLKRRTLVDTAFYLTANNSTTGGKFNPEIPTSGTTYISDNDAEEHAIYRSRYHEPEAVPNTNKERVGKKSRAIFGIVALREALLIFKEDGAYYLSGESDGGAGSLFRLDQFDPTIRIKAPNSLVVLDNAAMLFADQGVWKISAGGGGIISRAVEVELLRIAEFANFSTITRAVAYESDRKYLLFLQDASSDTRAKTVWVYNTLTNAWTTYDKDLRGGLINSSDNKLYVMHNVDKYILQERKSYSTADADYIDEDITCTVTATGTTTWNNQTVSTATVTWSYTTQLPQEGDYFTESGSSNTASVVAVEALGGSSYKLTLDAQISIAIASATVGLRYLFRVIYVPEDAGNQNMLKQFAAVAVYPEVDGTTAKLGFKADTQNNFEFTDNLITTRSRGWGSSPWGSSAWGDGTGGKLTALRSIVPRDHQICRSLELQIQQVYAHRNFNILQASYNVRAISELRTERF